MTTWVVGLGQPVAGDDGVAYAVLDALAGQRLPKGVRLTRLRDASGLLPLLERGERLVIVDAVLGAGAPGRVHVFDVARFDGRPPSSLSSHGLGVVEVLELARSLVADRLPEVTLVAVSIRRPDAYGEGLSPAIADAVPTAVSAVLSCLKSTTSHG